MEDIESFAYLPDGMEADELDRCFLQFLSIANTFRHDAYTLFSGLCELAERQWHCYEGLNNNTKQKIEEWVNSNIIIDDIVIVRKVIFILSHVGLQKTYEGLKQLDLSFLPKPCGDYLLKSFAELGDDISDPYKKLKEQIKDKNRKYEIIDPNKEGNSLG